GAHVRDEADAACRVVADGEDLRAQRVGRNAAVQVDAAGVSLSVAERVALYAAEGVVGHSRHHGLWLVAGLRGSDAAHAPERIEGVAHQAPRGIRELIKPARAVVAVGKHVLTT